MKVQISTPCHENWNGMTPQDKGRFCEACQKCVVDFTAWQDAQIIAYLKKHEGENLCGRFQKTQLNRPLLPIHKPQKPSFCWAAAASLLLLSAVGLAENKAATLPNITQNPVDKKGNDFSLQIVGDTLKIRGTVKDSTSGEPLIGASIVLGEHGPLGTVANIDGIFDLAIPTKLIKTDSRLFIAFTGYHFQSVLISDIKDNNNFNLVLAENTNMVFGDIVVGGIRSYTPREGEETTSFWQSLKNVFKKKKKE